MHSAESGRPLLYSSSLVINGTLHTSVMHICNVFDIMRFDLCYETIYCLRMLIKDLVALLAKDNFDDTRLRP